MELFSYFWNLRLLYLKKKELDKISFANFEG